jgi:hypothetical protein
VIYRDHCGVDLEVSKADKFDSLKESNALEKEKAFLLSNIYLFLIFINLLILFYRAS